MYYILALISGILTALPIHLPLLFFLPYFSISLIAYIIFTRGYLFCHALMYAVGYFGIGYLFIYGMYPMEYASVSRPVAALLCFGGWLLLVLLSALPLALVAPVCRLAYPLSVRLGGAGEAVALAAGFALYDLLAGYIPIQFQLIPLALTQTDCLPLVQGSALFGSPFVSFIIVFVASLLALGFRSFSEAGHDAAAPAASAHHRYRKLVPGETAERKKTRSAWTKKNSYVVAATFTVLLSYIFGLLAMGLGGGDDESKKVSIIQANIGTGEKWGGTASADALAEYLELSAYSADSDEPDIIVWPETAVSVDLGYYESYAEQLESFASDSGCTLIIGAFSKSTDYDDEGSRLTKTYNSVYAVSPEDGIEESTVRKKHLVPFGEYVPLGGLLGRIFPALHKLNLSGTELTAGSDGGSLTTGEGTVGALVCSDSLYPSEARRAARDGKALFILSNDSWYGRAGSELLLRSTVLRSVETGRFTVRSASTGISAFISPTGVILDSIDYGEDGYITADIGMRSGSTIASLTHDAFSIICGLFLLMGAIMNAVLYRRELAEERACAADENTSGKSDAAASANASGKASEKADRKASKNTGRNASKKAERRTPKDSGT